MKATTFIKKIDELGRIVIPKDVRNALGVSNGENILFSLNGDSVILKKLDNVCAFCGADNELIEFKGKFLCENCKKELSL